MAAAPGVLVVGAGYAGSVCARILAEAGRRVLVIDRRAHIGGNTFDEYDRHGMLVHRYGPHIFHTDSKRVFDWLSQFTEWRAYEHRVLASVDGMLLPIPINRTTINRLYGLDLDEVDVAAFLDRVREPRTRIRTSEDVVLNSVGRDLCERFFRGYTRKQWGLDLSELGAGVAARIPTRTDDDDRYFGDAYQAIPRDGYTRMFENILDHPRIEIRLGVDFDEVRGARHPARVVYTGPVDAYFRNCYGPLPYRSLRFEHEYLSEVEHYQPVGTVNHPNEHAYTRITEFKHLTGQSSGGTAIVREYPQDRGDPYYPVPRPENEQRYQEYKSLVEVESGVTFVGRLAQYRYYNMDQVVAAALNAAERILGVPGDG
ncbi:MAG TPA: UDP-galactopyranose mutase [Rhizobiales bacterium]|nr:UDP-galactopyranose mutase [Hyphomicrobiales bacterium]